MRAARSPDHAPDSGLSRTLIPVAGAAGDTVLVQDVEEPLPELTAAEKHSIDNAQKRSVRDSMTLLIDVFELSPLSVNTPSDIFIFHNLLSLFHLHYRGAR